MRTYCLFLLLFPLVTFAGPLDLVFDHAFDKAVKSAGARGAKVPATVRDLDKKTAREACKVVTDHYERKGLSRDAAEGVAVEKTAQAYEDVRVKLPKTEGAKPVTKESLVAYSGTLSRITITSAPGGAAVSIDGQACGPTEVSKWLGEDDHKIVASLAGFQNQEKVIHPKDGKPETVAFTFPP